MSVVMQPKISFNLMNNLRLRKNRGELLLGARAAARLLVSFFPFVEVDDEVGSVARQDRRHKCLSLPVSIVIRGQYQTSHDIDGQQSSRCSSQAGRLGDAS